MKADKSILKKRFSQGMKPNGEDFSNLIDSFVHQKDDQINVVETTRNVGIGTDNPQNKLDVNGAVAIGSYSGKSQAPKNGLIVEGPVGIGSNLPNEKLTVAGAMSLMEVDVTPESVAGFGKLYVKKDSMVSLLFSGDRQLIKMPPVGETVGDFTISVWFKLLQHNNKGRSYILDLQGGIDKTFRSCGLVIDAGLNGTAELHHFCTWADNTSAEFAENVGNIDKEWHHTVLSREGNILKVFFDGNLLSVTPKVGTTVKKDLLTWNKEWRVGFVNEYTENNKNYWFNGHIDELSIWKKTLPDEEINNIFLAGRSLNLKNHYSRVGLDSEMIGYWRMGDDKKEVVDLTGKIPDKGIIQGAQFYPEEFQALHFLNSEGLDIVLSGGGSSGVSTSSLWGRSESGIYFNQGNVGIGIDNPLALLAVKGQVIKKVFVATANGPVDGTDNGQIVTRVLSFEKLYPETAVKITYCDNFRLAGPNTGISAQWEIRVNGTSIPGGPITMQKYNHVGNSSESNFHEPSIIKGFAKGLPAGSHTIGIWVSTPAPGHSSADCYTGWQNCTWSIEAEEVWLS